MYDCQIKSGGIRSNAKWEEKKLKFSNRVEKAIFAEKE
ncbi:MAG: hypothetical protein ACJAYM_002458 [Flavobacteriales bacterium]